MKPYVAVFLGGTSGSRDLSCETGYWVCEYLPRHRFRVIPIHITAEGQWQVPLGTLPAQGSVRRMLDMLWQAIPAVPARQAMERLFRHPLHTLLTVIRGKGGDDGSLHTLGATTGIPVVGPSPLVCQQTSQKHLCAQIVGSSVRTPRWRHFRRTVPVDFILETARNEFVPPFFIKPVHEEGSFGVERVTTMDEVVSAVHRAHQQGDFMLQEEAPGEEVTFTLVDDVPGKVRLLPAVRITPRTASFYDVYAKRRGGGVVLDTVDWRQTGAMQQAADTARGLYDELDCHGLVSFDMKVNTGGPYLLEINTVPSLTEYSILKKQLDAAHLHPGAVLQRLVDHSLMMDTRRAAQFAAVK